MNRLKLTIIPVILSLILSASPKTAIAYENVFTGIASDKNISFNDVFWSGGHHWAGEAVFQAAVMGIAHGVDEERFLPDASVTRVEALAFLYRAFNAETGEANSAGSWADGYLELARDRGLILHDGFEGTIPAQRQEIAYWAALIMGVAPAYDYTIFNTYFDGRDTDDSIKPYLNAFVNRGIMVGADGFLNPRGAVTRAEIVQVILNCEDYVLKSRGIIRREGKITKIPAANVIEMGQNVIALNQSLGEGLMVFADGVGGVELLKQNDTILYYTNSKNNVLFAKAYALDEGTSYITSGIVYSVNTSGRRITLYDQSGKTDPALMRSFDIAPSTTVIKNGNHASFADISVNDNVFLRVSEGIVTEISFSSEKATAPISVQRNITTVYKAVLNSYNIMESTISVQEALRLEGSFWGYTPHKGILKIRFDLSLKIYNGNTRLDIGKLDEYIGKEIIIAIDEGADGEERAVFLRATNLGGAEALGERVTSVDTANRRVGTESGKMFTTGEGTLIIKNGQAVPVSQISRNDRLQVAAVETGRYYSAYVIYVDEPEPEETLKIYYGKLTRINIGESVIVESSREYSVTSRNIYYSSKRMTFKLTNNTRVFDEYGIVNNRDLNVWSRTGYYSAVNIAVRGDEVVSISLSRAGDSILTARVNSLIRQDGQVTGLNVYSAWYYVNGRFVSILENGPLYTLKNTLILKKGVPIDITDIKEGDTITVFYADTGEREALIISVN